MTATAVARERKRSRTLLDFSKGRLSRSDFSVKVGGVSVPVYARGARRGSYSLVSSKYELVNSLERAFLLGSYYSGRAAKAYLKFYSDREDKVYVWYDQTGHLPYFICDLSPETVSENRRIVNDESFVRVEVVEKYNLLLGEKQRLTKIVVKDPQAVPRLRKLVPRAWEARIKYHDNYVFDNGLIPGIEYSIMNGKPKEIRHSISKEVMALYRKAIEDQKDSADFAMRLAPLFETRPPNIRRLAIDIEVYTPNRGRVPDAERTPYPVISVALFGSDGMKKVLVLAREGMIYGDVESIPIDIDVEIFDSERALLIEAFRIINDYPLILTFNGDGFDLPYLYNRALTLGIDPDYIPIEAVRDFISVKHGFHIDLYKFFSIEAIQNYAFGSAYKEKTLDAIATALLGEAKVVLEEAISDLRISKLVEYNAKDAELTLKLTMFGGELVWKLIVLIMRLAKMGLEDVTRRKVSAWVKNLMYWEHRKRGYLIPNEDELLSMKGEVKTAARIGGKRYAGAIVIDPIPGVYFRVTVLDFASLYPSIIKVWNLSYETIDPPKGWCPDDALKEVRDESGNLLHRVCFSRKGITTEIVGMLRDFRVRVYKKLAKDPKASDELRNWYDVVQKAMKVYINASYGVFGHEKFPFYTPSLAESVTALGRYVITSTLKKAGELGLKVLYGDTDSLFLWDPDRKALEELIEWVGKKFSLDLELDKQYKYVAFALKKNYLGVYENGKIDVKGLVGKKRNVPLLLQETFNKVIQLMTEIEDNPSSLEKVKENVKKEVKELYIKLKNRDFTLDEIAFKTTLNKDVDHYQKTTPIHVKAALQLRRYGLPVVRGDIIMYVKTKTKDKVKAIQLAKLDDVNVHEYMDAVKSVLTQVLLPFNISWEEIAGGVGLFGFLGNSTSKRR